MIFCRLEMYQCGAEKTRVKQTIFSTKMPNRDIFVKKRLIRVSLLKSKDECRNKSWENDVTRGSFTRSGVSVYFHFCFSVVFKNQKCLDCGLTGDVRLMSNYCHMEKVFVHPGSLIQYHPKRTERYHDSTTVIREHPGGLYRPWYSLDFFICKMGGERYFLKHFKISST